MKFIVILFVLSLNFSSCLFTEEACDFENHVYELTDEISEWKSDSLSNVVVFRASNNFEESYRVGKEYIDTWDELPDHCNNERQYSRFTAKSTISNSEYSIEIESGRKGDEISIVFNQFSAIFNFTNMTSTNITLGYSELKEDVMLVAIATFLPELKINDTTFTNVLSIAVTPDKPGILKESSPKTIYIAKHYGVIAYQQYDGLYWELIKR